MDQFKKGGMRGNSNLFATNRLFVKNPLFKKKKKRAPGVYNPNAKFRYEDGGSTSFDYDNTLSTQEGLDKAKATSSNEKYVVSARPEVTPDMIARAEQAGIPQENIYATGSDKAKVAKVKELGVDKHLDDKESVINALGLRGELFENGGFVDIDIDEKDIDKYVKGGYIIQDISIPTLNQYDEGGIFKRRKRKVFDPNAKYYQEGGEQGCPEGYAFNPKTGECIEWNPDIRESYDQPTSFDPVGDVIYMNPDDRPEGMSDEEYAQMYDDQLEHEQLHRLQWKNDELKGENKTPLRMPSTVDNQEYDGDHYYNRRGEEEKFIHDIWNQRHPDLKKFIPEEVVYNNEINPVMYELPWTEEGEARGYEGALHSGMESLFPKHQDGGEYGMPLGAGVSQNFIGNRDEFKVGGIPNLPLRDNRVNYNAYVNRFEPKDEYEDGGFIETELTDDEIQAYRDGGYIVEDISIPSLTKAQRGGIFGRRKKKQEEQVQPEYVEPVEVDDEMYESVTPWNQAPEDFKQGVGNIKEVDVKAQAPNWLKFSNEYEKKNSRQAFIDEKKREYLKSTNKGLNKLAGNSMENFPEDVERNFEKAYDYKKNSFIVKKLGKKEKFSPNRRGEWIDDLSKKEKEIVANSKYESKLQPSLWDRTVAGFATMASPFSPEINAAMNRGDLPGLTKKEQREIKDSKILGIPTGGLEAFSGLDAPGVAIANVLEQSGNSGYGAGYREAPGMLSGQPMANVKPEHVMALNPLNYTAAYDIPMLGKTLLTGAKNISKTAKESPSVTNTIDTPSGFQNRVFDSNVQLGSFQGKGHLSEKGYNYRTLGDQEIKAIQESKGVFPKKGKAKGGNENVKYWTKGNEKNWYAENPNQQVIRVKDDKFNSNQVVNANDVEVYNHNTGQFESILPASSNNLKTSKAGLTNQSIVAESGDDWLTVDDVMKHKDAFEDLKRERLFALQSSKGQERLKNFIEQNPHIQGTTGSRALEMDPFIPTQRQLLEGLANTEYVPELLVSQKANMEELQRMLRRGEVSKDDYEEIMTQLNQNIKNLEYKADDAYMASSLLKPNAGRSHLMIGSDFTPDEAKRAIRHEIGHYFQGEAPSHLDEELSALTLREAPLENAKQIPNQGGYAGKVKSSPDYFKKSKKYWETGSKGQEKVPFMEEVRADMLEKGIIKNLYDDITPEMLEQHYSDYHSTGDPYPLRVYDIMQPEKKNFSLMSNVLNKMPVVVPVAGAAFLGAGSLKQNKKGGSTKNYIELDIPDNEIQNYIKQGYIVEPVSKLKKFIS